MATIVAIPSYYRTSSYVFVYNDKNRPTTTARYIVLTPASTEELTTRNAAIAKDVTAWGWHVYNTDSSLPNMEKWLSKYDAAAKKNTWDEDIWKIWQREHGVKIAREEEEAKRRAGEKGKMGGLVHGVKKVGVFWGRFAMTLDSDERWLRKEEAEGEEQRRWKVADGRVAERCIDLPSDPFADLETGGGRGDMGGHRTGGLRGGGGAEEKGISGNGAVASGQVVLTRHSWLLGG